MERITKKDKRKNLKDIAAITANTTVKRKSKEDRVGPKVRKNPVSVLVRIVLGIQKTKPGGISDIVPDGSVLL